MQTNKNKLKKTQIQNNKQQKQSQTYQQQSKTKILDGHNNYNIAMTTEHKSNQTATTV